MPLSRKTLTWAALAAILAFASVLHLTRLGTGAPSMEKNLLIFGSREAVDRWAQPMMDLRQKYYTGVQDMLNPDKAFKETYDKLYHANEAHPPLSELPQEFVLDRARGYCLGVFNSDEQNTVSALSKINPARLQFNPGVNSFYGGFYYYVCGGALFTAKLLGRLTLTSDLKFYFSHPEQTRAMYAVIRGVGAVALLLCVAALFFWLSNETDALTGLWAAAFLAFIPVLTPYSHMAKAHIFGMTLFFLGFALQWRAAGNPSWMGYLSGSALLGLSAASIITNLPTGIAIFFIEWVRRDWDVRRVFLNAKFWMACAVFFALYALFNWYIFLNFAEFQRSLLGLQEYMQTYGETYGQVRLGNWIPFLIDMFTNQLHWTSAPVILIGIWASATHANKLFRAALLSFLFLFMMNLLLTRHPGVNIRSFPLLAVIFAAGAQWLVQRASVAARFLGTALVILSLVISILHASYYYSLLKEPSAMHKAAEWVNINLPKGSAIGVVDGQFSQASLPGFSFLEYRLVHFPRPSRAAGVNEDQLPEYVVTVWEDQPLLKTLYVPVQEWRRPRTYLGIPFKSYWVGSGEMDIFVYQKRSKAL